MARSATMVGAAVMLVMAGMVQGANAEGPGIAIRFSQHREVPRGILTDAQNIVSDIYARAGVGVVWADSADDRVAALQITVIFAAEPPVRLLKLRDVVAIAIAPERGCGRIAYVVWPRVQAFADGERVPVANVLGRVLAHEVGHLLLGPNAHSPDGIMRAEWNNADFTSGNHRAGFTPEQSARLHQTDCG